jgi:hypothetical protein
MNTAISIHNEEESENSINLFTESEFLTGFALMIGASCYSDQGKLLRLIGGLLFSFFLLIFFVLQVATFGLQVVVPKKGTVMTMSLPVFCLLLDLIHT